MEMGRGLGLEIFATKGGRGKANWGVCLEMGGELPYLGFSGDSS